MQNPKWESTGMYEHPAKHQKGKFGKIQLSQAGVYVLNVGGAIMSCPPDWASKIHADETKKSDWITIRVSPADKSAIESDAQNAGLDNVSSYILMLWRKYR